EDRYRLASLDRIGEPCGGGVHVAEDRRVGHEAAQRRRALALDILARHPAREQQLGDEIVGRQPLARHVGAGAAPLPRLAEDRPVDAQRGAAHGRVRAARMRVRSASATARGIAGISWLPSALPPGTPKTSVAIPKRRRMKSTLKSALCTEAKGSSVVLGL